MRQRVRSLDITQLFYKSTLKTNGWEALGGLLPTPTLEYVNTE